MEEHRLKWTGERFLPWFSDIQPDIALEHSSRYYMARKLCYHKDVLDVASGEGYGSNILVRDANSVLGIDISNEAVLNAKERYRIPNLDFQVCDATQLEMLNRKFDVVTAFEMIEHIEKQELFVSQVKKVLKDKGIFIVSTPNKYVSENEWHTENEYHIKELYFDEFKELLKNSFKYCYFYGQRVYRASESWCLDDNSKTAERNAVYIDEEGVREVSNADKVPSYFFCVCSDRPVDDLDGQYYLTDVSDCMKKNIEQENEVLKNPEFHYTNKYVVYYDYGNGFSEENKEEYVYRYTGFFDYIQLKVDIPKDAKKIRIDPVNQRYCIIKNLKISNYNESGIISNCSLKNEYGFFFSENKDPMLILDTEYAMERTIEISYEILVYESVGMMRLLEKKIEEVEKEKSLYTKIDYNYEELKHNHEELKQNYEELKQVCEESKTKLIDLKENALLREKQHREEISDLTNTISAIYQSTSWKISMPVRFIGNFGRWLVNHSRFLHKCYTATQIMKHGGVKQLVYEIKHYDEIKLAQKSQMIETVDCSVDSEYQENIDFSDHETDVKMLAFYLPQYHVFPENDEWWGKGFTEWTNVKSGDSRFEGHYQPRVPNQDIGYYDLSDINVIKKQAKLAKQHGIYGFCFYYYWFSGKRLMEKPLDMLLEHSEIDLPFCLCWANENWTRAWDGQNKNVLIAQEYTEENDERFIVDLKKYIDDDRYIRINGKPLIMVYNPGQIPDCHKSFKTWRNVAKEIGIGEILIWTCQTSNNTAKKLNIEDCIDAEVEFPPHNMWLESAAIHNMDLSGKSAYLYSYSKVVDKAIENMNKACEEKIPVHHGCMLAWDNAARRKDGWFTYCGFSLKSLYKWVLAISKRARIDFQPEERFVFINAWNEWGEGTYLEPDEKYGYANINTVSKALMGLPFRNDFQVINMEDTALGTELFQKENKKVRIVVQIHMFYLDTLEETIRYLNMIPYAFDCYVSTDTKEKKKRIEESMNESCRCSHLTVEVYLNRGRDVAPFLVQMRDRIKQYDYICHIHSKKTKSNDHGNEWRKYNFEHLLGSDEYLKRIFYVFEQNPDLGIVMPEIYPVLEFQAEWGGNKEGVQTLLDRIGIQMDLPKEPVFPVGNMFWARTKAIEKIFDYGFAQKDFPKEEGQVNATLAHQIERSWIYIIQSQGYSYQKVFNNCFLNNNSLSNKKRLLVYVHYDKNNILSEDDLKTLDVFSEISDEILFATNSSLNEKELTKVKKYTSYILRRKNVGYDFGAWKEILMDYGRNSVAEFDELILLNNSCFAPIFPIKEMFQKMEDRDVDFWGNTLFPYSSDGTYIGKECIPEHLQSYFMVFNNNVIQSDVFWNFWENVTDYKEFTDVIAECESVFTKTLSDAGFSYEPYIRESYYISRFLNNYSIPYEKPCSLLLLKDPFVKKKCYQYMSEEERIRLEYLMGQFKKNISNIK